MLRCKGIEAEEPARSLFQIVEGDEPASPDRLERVARIADVLLRENSLSGSFQVSGPGLMTLELPEAERTFFHNGIVFAALDAFNDPVKNPTLTLFAADDTD